MSRSYIVGKKWAVKIAAAACAYGGTLGLVGGAAEADAKIRELPSSICHAQYDNNGTNVNNSGLLSYTSTGTKSIYCPVAADNGFSPASATGVSVYGFESTNGANSRVCSCYPTVNTCSCSGSVNWSNTTGGMVASGLSTSEWVQQPETEFRYVLHSLSENSSLAGMILTD